MKSNNKLSRRDFLRTASVTLAGAALAACAPAVAPQAPAEKQENPTTAPAAPEAVTISVSSWVNVAFKNGLEQFNAKYPNIKVELIDTDYAAYHDKLLTSLVSGTGAADVAGIGDERIKQLAETGGLADLTDFLAPYRDKLVKYKLQLSAFKGKNYGVPWDGAPCMLYYRRDICEQYQIDPEKIETYEDWYQAGLSLKEATDGKVRLWGLMGKDNVFPIINWCWQQGGGLYNADESKVIIDNEVGVKTLTFIKKLWDDEVIHHNPDWDTQMASYKDGTSVLFTAAIWLATDIAAAAPETVGKWGVVRVPAWEKGGSRVFTWGGSSLGIPAQGKHIEEALKFVEYFNLTQAGQEAQWLGASLFPVLVDAKDWPIMNKPLEFYGGQTALREYAEVNGEVVPYVYGRGFAEASQIVGLQQAEALDGNKSPEQALKDAAQEIRVKQKLG